MIATLVVLILAVTLAAILMVAVVRGGLSRPKSEDVNEAMVPVHVPALLNLLDESQQDYLKARLPKSDFERIQRKRNRALLVYVKRIAFNAATLMRFAHVVSQTSDPEIAAAGRELMQSALSTRLQALRALSFLYVGVAVPSAVRQLGGTIARYTTAKDRFAVLGQRINRSAGSA